ncbi:MAG: GAF domain-containing protein [Deltaproteobacteria bacterium]|nr:MAG: GAF domain-containing protein [Deltaproteobacteria bacterium]
MLHRIERLNAIGTALSAETDTPRLLEIILLGAKELTGADGGSLYILAGRALNFELIHTTSLGLHMGGTSGRPVTFPPIPLDLADGAPNLHNVVTTAINEQRLVNVPDAYQDQRFDFSGTRAFDQRTGYRSQSFLSVPMQDHEGKIIGALQLLNAIDPATGRVIPFSSEDEGLVASLASQAAIALTRKRLIDGLKELLQALIRLIANAIDDKSPHTGGHCRRVPAITMALARAVNADDGPRFGTVHFTEQEMEELEMAAWLHDCGKITTPEFVVDKHTKLETIFDRIHLVDARIEILRRDLEIAGLKARLAAAGSAPAQPGDDSGGGADQQRLDEQQEFLRRCNVGGFFVDNQAREQLAAIAGQRIRLAGGEELPLLTENELYNLSVARGTLTDEERQIINNHSDASLRMLETLPFPDYLRRVPEIAGGHHERMDGKGYPRGVPAGQLSLQSRILAIADIFEALTASDRVYRKPNTLSETLTIMARMCREGHIDRELLTLLIDSEAYLDYARQLLRPEQLDTVDRARILAILD